MVGRDRLKRLSTIPALDRAAGAGYINLFRKDVRVGFQNSIIVAFITCNLIVFKQSFIARHHLIGFRAVVIAEPLYRMREA